MIIKISLSYSIYVPYARYICFPSVQDEQQRFLKLSIITTEVKKRVF